MAFPLAVPVKYPEQVRPCIYTASRLEMINKEIKRRAKTIEAFSSEESLISVLYLILKTENERLRQRGLRGFGGLLLGEEGKSVDTDLLTLSVPTGMACEICGRTAAPVASL
ncbi:MAG: transposase [Actinomycetota bacterium]|nr:transposase [Actinomycetota bacterium]